MSTRLSSSSNDGCLIRGVMLFVSLWLSPFIPTAMVTALEDSPAVLEISEFMAANSLTIEDEDGNSSDWIEIHNASSDPVPLAGYSLTDDPLHLAKWEFPDIVLEADEYLIVFASGKDRAVAGAELHANFDLEREGAYLALVNPDGVTIASEFNFYPTQYSDVSYGLLNAACVYFRLPSPGREADPVGLAGPWFAEVTKNLAARPTAGEPVIVTSLVQPLNDPVTSAQLSYRVMFEPPTTIPMHDDGSGGDVIAGDGVYTGTIPGGIAQAGDMIRWRVAAVDLQGRESRSPSFYGTPGVDPGPQYWGTVVADPSVVTRLPIFEWFVQNELAVDNVDKSGGRAAVFYLGEFYDNVFVRTRGWSIRLFNPTRLKANPTLPKLAYTIDFNPGHEFRWRQGEERVGEVKLNSTGFDKYYIRNRLAAETFERTGVPYADIMMIRAQRNGEFFSVAQLTEDPSRSMLRRNGLDARGAFYKVGTSSATQSFGNPLDQTASGFRKVTREDEGIEDLEALVAGLALSGLERKRFVFDNLNLPAVINYMATRLGILGDFDATFKNYYIYRDTEGTGQWQMMPWDYDFSFGYMTGANLDGIQADRDPDGLTGGNRMLAAIYAYPELREMYFRRIMTLMENTLQFPGTPYGGRWFEQRADFWLDQIRSDIPLDHALWQYPLHDPSVYDPVPANGNVSLETMDARIKSEFFDVHREFLFNHPTLPLPYQTGLIQLGKIEFDPVSGNQDEEYVELINTNLFAVDVSGWRITGAIAMELPQGTVIPSTNRLHIAANVTAFLNRAQSPHGGESRFVIGNFRGNLSNFGETLELRSERGALIDSKSFEGIPSDAQLYLRITEFMFHPPPLAGSVMSPDEFEYIELQNIGPRTLDLTNVGFVDGVRFSFTGADVTELTSGEVVLIVANRAAFETRYGDALPIAGEYTQRQSNIGERLRLVDAAGGDIIDFEYAARWYPVTDGLGFSLSIRDVNTALNLLDDKEVWRPSGEVMGSPGAENPGETVVASVRVNEVLARSPQPLVDTVELFNPTEEPVTVGGWFLTDDYRVPKKFRIPTGTVIPAGGYLLLDETDFNAGSATSFAFSSRGDEVFLFSGDASTNLTGYFHGFEFDASASGMSFGRYVTSTGQEDFVAQSLVTMGQVNAGPSISPLVISEIMYHPPDQPGELDNSMDEFIELVNVTDSFIPLFEPSTPANTWRFREAVRYTFPRNVVVTPRERLLIVPFDPIANAPALDRFVNNYAVPEGIRIFGPYSGKLDNSGEIVKLYRPDRPDTNEIPWVLVDHVGYHDDSPWPQEADGSGASLQRFVGGVYGNDPINWTAALPAAGRSFVQGSPPLILAQPASQSVIAFTDVAISVEVTGDEPFSYQWRRNGVNLWGATNETLFFPSISPFVEADYSVVIMNSAGVAVSSNATVNIEIPPLIVRQPVSVAVRSGQSAEFEVQTFSSLTTGYQWQLNGENLSGATNTTVTIWSAQFTNEGSYTVIVTDAVGSVISAPAQLILLFDPRVILPPIKVTAVVGQDVSLSVVSTGTLPMGYRWRRSGRTVMSETLNSHVSFLTITNVQQTDAGSYTVILSNPARPIGILSPSAALTVLDDSDGDLMADVWEDEHGLDPADASDAELDLDLDGMTSREEYVAGTDPNDASDGLRLQLSRQDAVRYVVLGFEGISNRTYTVESAQKPIGMPWTKWIDLPARGSNYSGEISVPVADDLFFRLVTPRQR